ncbi:hypothetical protein B0H13DRAFT_2466636 [Mycena leptocephala]|nr:hypothetical protein B0H13DRAFT_2466636 [Mycena leptocephala]
MINDHGLDVRLSDHHVPVFSFQVKSKNSPVQSIFRGNHPPSSQEETPAIWTPPYSSIPTSLPLRRCLGNRCPDLLRAFWGVDDPDVYILQPFPGSLRKNQDSGALFDGFVGFGVQGFFAFRIYTLSKKLLIPVLIWVLGFLGSVGTIGILVTALDMISSDTTAIYVARWEWIFTTDFSLSVVNDVIITATLVLWFLPPAPRRVQEVHRDRDDNKFITMKTNLFSNSLLASLNSRTTLRAMNEVTILSSTLIPAPQSPLLMQRKIGLRFRSGTIPMTKRHQKVLDSCMSSTFFGARYGMNRIYVIVNFPVMEEELLSSNKKIRFSHRKISFRDFLGELMESPSEEQLYVGLVIFSDQMCLYPPNSALINSTPGFQVFVVRAWACLLQREDITQNVPKTSLFVVHEFLTCGTVFLHDRIEGAGGSIDDLAALAMMHLDLVSTTGDAPLSSDEIWLLHLVLDIVLVTDGMEQDDDPDLEVSNLLNQDKPDQSLSPLCSALTSPAFVKTLTIIARTICQQATPDDGQI